MLIITSAPARASLAQSATTAPAVDSAAA